MYKREERPQVYLVTGFIDFRCGIQGLVARLTSTINVDPKANALFVFHLLDSLPYAERGVFDYSAFLPWSESLPPGMRVWPRETEVPQEGKTDEKGAV